MTPDEKQERRRKLAELRKQREEWLAKRKESDVRLQAAIQTLRELSGRA